MFLYFYALLAASEVGIYFYKRSECEAIFASYVNVNGKYNYADWIVTPGSMSCRLYLRPGEECKTESMKLVKQLGKLQSCLVYQTNSSC